MRILAAKTDVCVVGISINSQLKKLEFESYIDRYRQKEHHR